MIVNGYKSKAEAMRALRAAGFKFASLLSGVNMNPKLAKSLKIGVMSKPLHLAPARLSGFEVCPQRSAGCTAACLHTAGNPAYMAQKFKTRNAKTQAYFKQRAAFVAVLAFEIAALQRKAASAGMKPGVRLNATSDIAWERVALEMDGGKYASLMLAFPDVQFYDYTKVTKRAVAAAQGDSRWPVNYALTFSRTEDNDSDVAQVLRAGGNVAVVFGHKQADYRPGTIRLMGDNLFAGNPDLPGHEFTVIDGDEHDFRPADPRGCIVGLKAKGDARNSDSGFVLRLAA